MKVGVLQFFSWNRQVPLASVYESAFERIAIMDEGGYDAVWLAEHHFNAYSICPSVTVMGSHVAARTKRLRIGMGVTLAGFYHPLRLAEELALVDILSGGRLNWGAGRGFDPKEFRAFDVRPEDSAGRFRECVDIVLAAWANERVTYEGQTWQVRDVEVLPRPLQRPHPPVWLAATSPDSVVRAAKSGFTILMDPHASHADIQKKRALYQETLEESGHSMPGREIPIARLLAIAPTEREAEEVARKGAAWTVGSYVGRGKGDADPVERYVNEVVIRGTPASVLDRIRELEATTPMDYLLCAPLSQETFSLFTRQVLPKLGG